MDKPNTNPNFATANSPMDEVERGIGRLKNQINQLKNQISQLTIEKQVFENRIKELGNSIDLIMVEFRVSIYKKEILPTYCYNRAEKISDELLSKEKE